MLNILKKYKTQIAQVLFLVACLVFWQVYANQRNIMGFPPLDKILVSLVESFTNPQRNMLSYLGNSMLSILKGLGIGVLLSVVFSGLSAISKTFYAI